MNKDILNATGYISEEELMELSAISGGSDVETNSIVDITLLACVPISLAICPSTACSSWCSSTC